MGKIDFVKKMYETFSKNTKIIIFMNTKKYAEPLFKTLKDYGILVASIFSDMRMEERDENIKKFRDDSINTIITSNYLARGIDILNIKLVINFDVPSSPSEDGT